MPTREPGLTIGIILYQHTQHLTQMLSSLLSQETSIHYEIRLRDQTPEGLVLTWLQEHEPDLISDPRVLLHTGENLGHSGGHNALIAERRYEHYLTASYDMVYSSDCIEELLAAHHRHPDAALTGKLLRWESDGSLSSSLDSTGLVPGGLLSGLRDRGQGEQDRGQYEADEEVVGATGAFLFFPGEMIESLSRLIPEAGLSLWDDAFHYKNDTELSLRMQALGLQIWYAPRVRVWHERQLRQSSALDRLLGKNKDSLFSRASSAKGAILLSLRYDSLLRGYCTRFLRSAYFFLWERDVWPHLRELRKDSGSFHQRTQAFLAKKTPVLQHKPSIAVLILDYHKASAIASSLPSLLSQKGNFSLSIHILDNSCDEGNWSLLEPLAREHSCVHLTRNPSNTGYTEGYRELVQNSQGDLLLILNPDISLPTSDTLSTMLLALLEYGYAGLVAPHQIRPDGSTERTLRDFPTPLGMIFRRTPLRSTWPFSRPVEAYELPHRDYTKVQIAPWIQSSCYLMHRSDYDAAGGFDSRYKIFMSDITLCQKLHDLSRPPLYIPMAQVQADGKRASGAQLSSLFLRKSGRIHITDSLRYFWHRIF